MTKNILYVGREPLISKVQLEILREIGNFECDDVYRGEIAIDRIGKNNYDGVFMGDLRISMQPPLGDYCENGIGVVKVAREKGLPVLVLHPFLTGEDDNPYADDTEGNAKKITKMGATILQTPAHLDEIISASNKVFGNNKK